MSLRENQAGNTQTFFNYTLKHNWQHLMFYIILALLVIVLPTVVIVGQFSEEIFSDYESKVNHADEVMVVCAGLTFVVSCAIGVFAGMSTVSYVNQKQAVGCFHSFPLTRRTIFLAETGVRGLYYLVAMSIAVTLSWGLLELNMPHTLEARLFYIRMLILSVLTFALLYSIVIFAAGLTGTALLRFIIFCLIVALPIAIYTLICLSVEMGMPDVNGDRYMDFNFVKWLCPVTFLADIILGLAGETVDGSTAPGFGVSVVLVMFPTAAFYFGGMLLHMKRRSETSGTSIIWKPVFVVIKYVVIFVSSVCGLLLFGAISDGMASWYFFGGLVGLILSFMLTNVVLYRSVRAMFTGVKGLCAMAVVMVLFACLTVYDAAGLNEHVYSSGNTRTLEITLNGTTVRYTDDEDIEVLVPMLKEYLVTKTDADYHSWNYIVDDLHGVDEATRKDMETYLTSVKYDNYYYDKYQDEYVYYDIPEEYYYSEGETVICTSEGPQAEATEIAAEKNYYRIHAYTDSYELDWAQIPVVGIPSYKDTWLYMREKNSPIVEYIISSEEYATEIMAQLPKDRDFMEEITVHMFDSGELYFSYYGNTPGESVAFYTRLIAAYDFTAEKRESSPLIGRIGVWANRYKSLPIYAADVEVINLAAEYMGLDLHFTSTEDVLRHMAKETEAAFLVEVETGRTLSLDEGERAEVYRMVYEAFDHYSNIPAKAETEKYVAVFVNESKSNPNSYDIHTTPIVLDYAETAARMFD